ncbi:MAG: hypothetical protein JW810_01010 [Sedimentisphaerales bacterium]|nr:hypothetical protein [Sedimentisphaerales bacterium]
MLNPTKRLTGPNAGGRIQTLVYFTLFFGYLWFEVDVRLIHHLSGASTQISVFYCTWPFLQQMLALPGGPVEYLCTFLVQFFRYAAAGALIVTVQAWLIAAGTDTIIRAVGGDRLRWFRFLGPTLILITYTSYTYKFVATTAFLAALLFACLYLKSGSLGPARSAGLYLALSVVLYYLAAGAALCFAAVCALWELLFARRRGLGLLYAAVGAGLPWIMGAALVHLSSANAYWVLTPWTGRTGSYFSPTKVKYVMWILYLQIPAFMLLAALAAPIFRYGAARVHRRRKSRPAAAAKAKARHAESPPAKRRSGGLTRIWWIARTAVICLAAGASIWMFHDAKGKAFLALDYYNHYRMWPQVIRAAEQIPYSHAAICARNRALYHTGRLGDDMFRYPQHLHGLLLTSERYSDMYWKKTDLYAELGLFNMAENLLTDAMGTFGEHPVILKHLAAINLVKANMATAEVYLKALSETLLDGDRARRYLANIEEDPTLARDREIQQQRSLLIEKDNLLKFISVEDTLLALLDKNPKNRMAFEYLMAFYLLSKDVNKFVAQLGRLDEFGIAPLPRHYEEAILVYNSVHPNDPFSLPGHPISSQTRQRAQNIVDVIQRYGGSKKAAFGELAKTYGDSYIFYSLYSTTGTGK